MRFTLTVNDGKVDSAEDTVTVSVLADSDPPQFPLEKLPARNWTQNTPIAAFTVPAATGGHGTLRYSIAGQPNGVTLSAARVVSGTPASAGMGTATVTVADDNNRTDTLTFDWTVQPAPVQDGTRSRPHILPDPLSVSAKDIFGLLRPAIPAASGASVTHFRFTVPLDRAGTWTIAIDGTPNAGSDWDLQGDGGRRSTSRNADERIRVTLKDGQTYNFSVFPFSYTHWTTLTEMKLTLTPPASTGPKFSVDTLGPFTWTVGVAIDAFRVPQAIGGDEPLSYAATGLPAGVTMSPDCIVSGTPTEAGSGTATVTVTDSRGRTDTLTFQWTVQQAVPQPGPITGPERSTDGTYTLTWTAPQTMLDVAYKLEERRRGEDASPEILELADVSNTFTRQDAGIYDYRVRACIGSACSLWSNTFTVRVNAKPVAHAGQDFEVEEDRTAMLDATGSHDPDAATGDTLIYEWTAPTDSSVTLDDINSATPTITAPNLLENQALVFSLVVTDADGVKSDSATVTVTVLADNDPPTARAGDDRTVPANTMVTLDGTASSDPEGQSLTYLWSPKSGTGFELSSDSVTSPTFTPMVAGTLTFTLSVDDGVNPAVTDTVTVTVTDTPPPPGPISAPERSTDGSFTLTWTAAAATQDVVYELEESVNGADWAPVAGTDAMTSRAISGRTSPGPHRYRVRACLDADRAKCSDWTGEHTVVVLPPGAMIAIPNPSSTGDYTVRWTPVQGIEWYRLYESTDAGATWQLVRGVASDRYHFSGRPAGEYRYSLELCFEIAYLNSIVCYATQWDPITVTVDYPAEPALVETGTRAGTLPYEAGVTKGGDAYINIPIEPVPGVNGLEPMLSIDYSGGRDRTRMAASLPGDTLGYGWRVSGFSTIRRCIKNQPADQTLAIGKSARLCLDGEPLIRVSASSERSANDAYWAIGTEYRTLRESFHRIVLKGTDEALWFEVTTPDGSVKEYGRTGDSRLKHIRYVQVSGDRDSERELFGGDQYHREVATDHYLWSINKHTDAFGNTMHYSYVEDERNAVRHPARIMYGEVDPATGAHDAVIAFQYVPRSDLAAVYMGPVENGVGQRQDLRLLAVQVQLDSKRVRTYRFKSERTTSGWQRLEKIQLCGFNTSGTTRECLTPITLKWAEPTATVPHTVTAVSELTDPLGRVTEFTYDTLTRSGTHTFLFDERPFGAPTTPSNVAMLSPPPLGEGESAPAHGGALKTVVTRVRRSNGIGGWHATEYAYLGRGFESTRHWGYLGFFATRQTDVASGVVTYTQYRLDYPYFGEIAAVHQYQGNYTSSARILSRRVMDHAHRNLTHLGGAYSVLPYVQRSTDWHYEGATLLGATQREAALTMPGNLLDAVTETVTIGHGATVSGSGSVWGDAPTYTITGVQRKTVSTVSLDNLTTAGRWLVGFADRVDVAHHKGASATADRTQTATFTRHAQTNRVNTVVRFPGDDQHRLSTDYGYTASGLLNSVKISGANVAERTTSAASFRDGRYPASITNPLKHAESFAYDARFGLPTQYTDANGRITRVSYDAFGREKTRTTPDGVVIRTDYDTCASALVTCPSVSGVTPAMWVSTNSPVSPKTVDYLDVLGRVIHTETEAFTGTAAYRSDTVYDGRGRVKSLSEPYTSSRHNASAPKTTYTYDVRDRVTGVSPADGGRTVIAYAAQSNHQVKVTVTETLANTAADTPSTQTTERYYNVLGELVKSVDGATATAAATDKVVTTYTYDGSGLPESVSVWKDATPGSTATRANSITTEFDHDVAGNRSRVVHPNLGTVTFAYTALGELRKQTDPAGMTTHTYDELGRLTRRKDPDGVAWWTYDPANAKGALGTRCYNHSAAAMECGTTPGFKEMLAYNAQSRLKTTTTLLRAGGATKNYVHRYTYDTRGRLHTTEHPTGLTVRSVYNAHGYLEALRDDNAPSNAPDLEEYLSMNAYGQVSKERYANGITTVRAFDPASGRLEGIDTTDGATVLQNTDYAWQSNGILKSRVSHRGGMNAKAETFTYDALDRLRSAVTGLTGNAAARTLETTYDRLGNLKGKRSSVSGDTGVSHYAYGNGGGTQPPLTTLTGVSIGGVTHTLTHDTSGRVTEYDRAGTTEPDRYIGWNARHLPTAVTVGDSLTDATPKAKDEFLYGPDGQRYYRKSTWEVKGATGSENAYPVEHTFYAGGYRETMRVGDPNNRSIATSQVSATVLHVRTTPVTGMPTTAFEYLHRDHLGSVESVSGADGSELKLQAYDPFGERRSGDWTRALTDIERKSLAGEAPQRTARGYTGHEHLERTGLIHMNGRVYDPVIGRFLSPDPVVADASFSQSWNAYSYALNSPLSYSDPSGTVVASGCPPSLCAGGGFGGGGFAPGTVMASSWHFSSRVATFWDVGFGSLPTYTRPTTILNIQDSSSATGGGSRGRQRLEDRRSGYYPWTRSRSVVLVRGQLINEPVGIGEEQSPADLPMDVLESAALDIAQAVIGLAGLIPVVGNVADGINAGISVARGNYQDAILDGASAIPGTGQATGAVMVGVRAERAFSAIKQIFTTRRSNSTILENKARGDAFRDEIAEQLRDAGRDVRPEVVKSTPFGRRVIDIEVRQNGRPLGGIETKVGSSRYHPSQRAKDEWLRRQGYPVELVRDR